MERSEECRIAQGTFCMISGKCDVISVEDGTEGDMILVFRRWNRFIVL